LSANNYSTLHVQLLPYALRPSHFRPVEFFPHQLIFFAAILRPIGELFVGFLGQPRLVVLATLGQFCCIIRCPSNPNQIVSTTNANSGSPYFARINARPPDLRYRRRSNTASQVRGCDPDVDRAVSPSAQFEDVEVSYGDPKSGEHYCDAVLRVRCDIEALVAERAAIRRALPPVEDLCAQAEVHVDAIAACGRPSLQFNGDKLRWAMVLRGWAIRRRLSSSGFSPAILGLRVAARGRTRGTAQPELLVRST